MHNNVLLFATISWIDENSVSDSYIKTHESQNNYWSSLNSDMFNEAGKNILGSPP